MKMMWVTRKNMQVDRAASVWLIKKFIDKDAEFEFVEESLIKEYTEMGIHTFDAKDAKYKHLEDETGGKYGDKCTFQTIMSEYGLDDNDNALDYMANVIYAADIGHKIGSFSPREGYGIWALTKGLSITLPDDLEKIEMLMDIFDAIYAYCKWVANN